MRNALKDLNTITTIPYQTLQKLFDKLSWVICDAVSNVKDDNSDYYSVDIGIGELDIYVGEEEVSYRFIPSDNLSKSIIETVTEGNNPLTKNIEEAVVQKIINAYKDFF